MLMILEIVLTIAAWKRGWRGWALIPVIASLSTGFILGLTGTSLETILDVGLIIDALCIITLVIMVIKRRMLVVS